MSVGWIESYGYIAIFIGSVLEGETILVLAGYGISRGYLDAGPALVLAVLGATVGDSLYYWIGRRFGPRVLNRYPATRPIRYRAVLFQRRWGRSAAFAIRFAYGLRILLPMMIGASRMQPARFHASNLLGALCFAVLYIGAGFLFGEAMEQFLDRIRLYDSRIVLGLLGAGLVFWAVREWRLRTALPDADGPGGGSNPLNPDGSGSRVPPSQREVGPD